MVWGSIYETFVISPSCPNGQYDDITGAPCNSSWRDQQCASGKTGCTGPRGPTGSRGPTGLTGPSGPAPPVCDVNTKTTIDSQAMFNVWNSGLSAEISGASSIGAVNVAQGKITSFKNCLKSEINKLESSSTLIASDQAQIESIDEEIKEAQNDVAIAKDRALTARNSDHVSSYYESWFPINRPLKHYTIPLLIGLSIFMISFVILLLFSSAGVGFTMYVPMMQTTSASFGFPFKIMATLAVLFFGLMIYAFLGRG